MADALSWVSLTITAALAMFTIWFQLFQYRRQHYPRLRVFARGVSLIEPDGSDVVIRHGFEVRIVNSGLRPVTVSQAHIEVKGIGPYWLSDAPGRVNIRLEAGEDKVFSEHLDQYYDRHKERIIEEGKNGPLIVRGVATTTDNRVFVSSWQRMDHIDGYPARWRLVWGNRLRKVKGMFSRKPYILN